MHQDLRAEQILETIKSNSDMVYRLAFAMVKNVQDAEDIHQETFIRYIRNHPEFESQEHERAWFIRVTTNLCKNLWKSTWNRRIISMDAVKNMEEHASISDKLCEEDEELIQIVNSLSSKYRVVIHLFYYEEMSIDEIAKALGLKPSNVRTRLTRARKMLKEWLKEDV